MCSNLRHHGRAVDDLEAEDTAAFIPAGVNAGRVDDEKILEERADPLVVSRNAVLVRVLEEFRHLLDARIFRALAFRRRSRLVRVARADLPLPALDLILPRVDNHGHNIAFVLELSQRFKGDLLERARRNKRVIAYGEVPPAAFGGRVCVGR